MFNSEIPKPGEEITYALALDDYNGVVSMATGIVVSTEGNQIVVDQIDMTGHEIFHKPDGSTTADTVVYSALAQCYVLFSLSSKE